MSAGSGSVVVPNSRAMRSNRTVISETSAARSARIGCSVRVSRLAFVSAMIEVSTDTSPRAGPKSRKIVSPAFVLAIQLNLERAHHPGHERAQRMEPRIHAPSGLVRAG